MKHIKSAAIFVFYLGTISSAIGLVFLFGIFTMAKLSENTLIKKQLKIQEESHVLGLFSAYKNNVDSCRAEAQKQKKDDEFIKATCIEAINSSLIAKSLKEWGYEDLLIRN